MATTAIAYAVTQKNAFLPWKTTPLMPRTATHFPLHGFGNLFQTQPRSSVATTTDTAMPIAVLGVAFDPVTIDEAVERIERMIILRRPRYVVTANVDFLVQARADVELRQILREADLTLCDGMPLVWASRLLGNPLPERVAGADLVPRLIESAVRNRHRLYFLGGTPDSNDRAVANLRARYPDLEIVGHYAPPFSPLDEMDNEEITRRIREARPDILFVSFGCPKAEKWIARHYRSLGVPVAIGIGATIDFIAGNVRRAPGWMQRCGAEWIFRLLQEPRRLFRRYATDLACFSRALALQWWRAQFHFHRRIAARPSRLLVNGAWHCLALCGHVDAVSLRRDWSDWEHLAMDRRHCLLDFTEVDFIDSTAVALLLRLQRQLRTTGRRMLILAPCAAVRRELQTMMLEDCLPMVRNTVEAWQIVQAGQSGSRRLRSRSPSASLQTAA